MASASKPKRSIGKILLNLAIGLVISVMVGTLMTWLITWVFPQVNPLISQILRSFGLPYQEFIMKMGWFGFSFVAGMVLTMAFTFPVQWIRIRLKRRRLVRSA